MTHTLHFLTDDRCIDEDNYWPIISSAVEAGIDVLQLRFKDKDKKMFYQIAKRLTPFLKQHHVTFLVNDHLDIALAVDADGVHLGQSDLPVEIARELLGPKKIIGLSLSSIEEYHQSKQCDADYYGVGPVFQSATKDKAFMGLNALQTISALSQKPCIAIGGITEKNVNITLEAGAAGIAVCQYIAAAPSPSLATQTLKHLL